jgi:hypothetical protein
MGDVLRVYDPAECDERGVPLDWERCREPECVVGVKMEWRTHDHVPQGPPCPTCAGRGSLKAAVLAHFMKQQRPDETCEGDPDEGTCTCDTLRCEDCRHPMGEGTWEGDGVDPSTPDSLPVTLEECLVYERQLLVVHYSPCDAGCRHGGPMRVYEASVEGWIDQPRADVPVATYSNHERVEASWRHVDVRTGVPAPPDHPHPMIFTRPWDLRPKNLALLCKRCYAERATC